MTSYPGIAARNVKMVGRGPNASEVYVCIHSVCRLNSEGENPLRINWAIVCKIGCTTGVLDKNKEHYLRCKNKAKKSYDVLRHIQLHMLKYQYNNDDLQPIMSNLQPNCCLKVDFQKSGPTCDIVQMHKMSQ